MNKLTEQDIENLIYNIPDISEDEFSDIMSDDELFASLIDRVRTFFDLCIKYIVSNL